MVYLALLSALLFVIQLPVSYYVGYAREHAYGLSSQRFGKWASDEVKGLVLGVLIGAAVLWVPYLLLRSSPERWWLWTGALALPFFGLVLLVTPVFIAPLFNKFGPMKDKALEAEVLAVAAQAGVEGARVFEVEKSVDTKKVNAYVTGVGKTKRIVLWDTLLGPPDAAPDPLRRRPRARPLRAGARLDQHRDLLGADGGRPLRRAPHGGRAARDVRRPLRVRPDLRRRVDAAPDAAARRCSPCVITPAMLALSRHHERAADRFGLELTRDNHAAATAFVALQQQNLAFPRPGWLYKLFRASHPPIGERVDFINEYRPSGRQERQS